MDTEKINIQLKYADVREFHADILALKHAQGKYGVDRLISFDLNNNGVELKKISPNIGHSVLIKNTGTTNYKKILFIGVKDLDEFGYKEIKRFSSHVLDALSEDAPETEHLAMTIHGVGYGLDENEALLSQIAGLFESIQKGDFPKSLKEISIIDNSYDRVLRLQKVLDQYLQNESQIKKGDNNKVFTIELLSFEKEKSKNRIDNIISAGEISNTKKHIFVAMPFKEDMNNTFYFGIQQPIHKNNFLCERIDQDTFTGDILNKIKNKIETASAIIADLTTQNPNVYLEVGYAWGIGKPTIFIIEENDSPRFDLQGQRHLKYNKENLFQLQEKLTNEIKLLVENGDIK